MKEAFSYMFRDNKYPQKALTYFALVFFANLATTYANLFAPNCQHCPAAPEYKLWSLIGKLLMILPTGYMVNCTKSLIDQKENFILPFFNFRTSLKTGLKYLVALFFLTSILALVFVGLLMGSIVLSALNGKFSNIYLVGVIIISLCLIFYFPALFWIFSYKGWFTSLLRWKKAVLFVSKGFKNYCKAWGFRLLLLGISGIILIIPVNNLLTVITVAIISSAFGSYALFVDNYLVAKSIKPECVELL